MLDPIRYRINVAEKTMIEMLLDNEKEIKTVLSKIGMGFACITNKRLVVYEAELGEPSVSSILLRGIHTVNVNNGKVIVKTSQDAYAIKLKFPDEAQDFSRRLIEIAIDSQLHS